MDAEIWVALAFILFMGILGYFGAHKVVAQSLDDHAGRIKAGLDEASQLKIEATQLLAEAQRKFHESESEAEKIIAGAFADADRFTIEAKTKIEEFVARRTKMAEANIALAEAQATTDVRNTAAEVAVMAAEKILTLTCKGELAKDLIEKDIKDIGKKLN
jgi:F-type H+-transporting ATPase subunit b